MAMDANERVIELSQWIPGAAYPSALYIVRAPLAHFDVPYRVNEPAIRNVLQVTYSAPNYTYKANQNMPMAKAQVASLGSLHGQAPTAGIYTGIPSGCGNNGITGGNPYS